MLLVKLNKSTSYVEELPSLNSMRCYAEFSEISFSLFFFLIIIMILRCSGQTAQLTETDLQA